MKTPLAFLFSFALPLSFVATACAVGYGDPVDLSPSTASLPAEPPAEPSSSSDASTADARADDTASDATARDAGPDAVPVAVPSAVPTGAADAALQPPPVEAGAACADYAEPALAAACNACGSKPCQANGCYNGYWCNRMVTKCQPKPPACP